MKKYQQGVGMIEIMVALIILSIAVLGFAVMQLRAVNATAEGFNRIQATNIARDLTEKIRINATASTNLDRDAVLSYYTTQLSSEAKQQEKQNCYTIACSTQQKAVADVNESYNRATDIGMTLGAAKCPATTANRQCIYVAWDKTLPKSGGDSNDCIKVENNQFSYNSTSTCIVMEAY